MRILELKAARGWSKAQTSERLFLRPATIAEWTKRIDEEGEDALVQTPEPINRFPDFVRNMVMRLKVLCPAIGKKRIAQTLARAGLALGVSTVGRILKEREQKDPEQGESAGSESSVRERLSKWNGEHRTTESSTSARGEIFSRRIGCRVLPKRRGEPPGVVRWGT